VIFVYKIRKKKIIRTMTSKQQTSNMPTDIECAGLVISMLKNMEKEATKEQKEAIEAVFKVWRRRNVINEDITAERIVADPEQVFKTEPGQNFDVLSFH
jgi:hypothetical protein